MLMMQAIAITLLLDTSVTVIRQENVRKNITAFVQPAIQPNARDAKTTIFFQAEPANPVL